MHCKSSYGGSHQKSCTTSLAAVTCTAGVGLCPIYIGWGAQGPQSGLSILRMPKGRGHDIQHSRDSQAPAKFPT